MPAPGCVVDPHLSPTSLDLYAESPGHLPPVSSVPFSPLLLRFSCNFLLFLPALDAPSSSVCSAVFSQDRLPCASVPVSQGDCEERGCCYDPRDRVKPCYFGNTGKGEQLLSLPPRGAATGIPRFPGRAGLERTSPGGGLGLCFLAVKSSLSH